MIIKSFSVDLKHFNILNIPSRLLSESRLSFDKMSEANGKRQRDGNSEEEDPPNNKNIKTETSDPNNGLFQLKHDRYRLVPRNVLSRLTPNDVRLLTEVTTSCGDLSEIKEAIKLRIKHRLCARLPQDDSDSSYYIKDNLRWVYPYHYIYQTFARRRWLGKTLGSVIREEFRDIPQDQLESRFKANLFLVKGEIASIDHVIKDNDFISHLIHRHELPVLATTIKIIYEDSQTLVINKPPSIPIHPCGRFRHNSITNILRRELGYENLRIVHRLDRLVSGVLIIAKNPSKAHKFEDAITKRQVEKVYVCRVGGEFPIGRPEDDGEIIVDQGLEYLPGKISLMVATSEGKPSLTRFKRLHYNGKTSSVICKPLTGRMHQIRVHLQYLGHPIVNDVLYNCDTFGPELGKGGRYGKSLAQLSADCLAKHRADTWLDTDNETTESSMIDAKEEEENDDDSDRVKKKRVQFLSESERQETLAALEGFFTQDSLKDLEEKMPFDESKLSLDSRCRDCAERFHDPPMRRLYMYLHALKYSGSDFCFESELPSWAKESWQY